VQLLEGSIKEESTVKVGVKEGEIALSL